MQNVAVTSERAADQAGRLVLAATPIGDVADAPPRLVSLLRGADVIAAEDTRRLRRLLTALDVETPARVVSYHEHNEASRAAQLIEAVEDGATVLVVSDAGMPSVSDPGLRVVRAAVDAGVPVSVVPGPSAVLTALALSGLATDRFCFEGFLPRRTGERARRLTDLAAEPRTMIFFEAPHRLAVTLAAMAEAFGAGRRAAVCRELTKTYEQVLRDSLAALAGWASSGEVLGEITVVVAGAEPVVADLSALAEQARSRAVSGERLKAVVSELAEASGVSKRELYNLATRSAGSG